MWKIAVFAFLCLYSGVASAGRLPRSDDDVSKEDCTDTLDCDDCKFVIVSEVCYKMATESENNCQVQEQCGDISDSLCIDGACIGQKGVGEPCTSNAECATGMQLVCNSGTCECSLGNVQFGDTCLIQAGALGDTCEEDVQCEGLTGVCVNGTCQAKGNEVLLCNDNNAELTDEGCRCREGFVETDDKKSCLKEAEKLGDECTITRQCESVNGTCTGGICTEVSLTAAAVPIEVVQSLVGSACETNEDCKSLSDSVCKESICQCSLTHVPSEDSSKCLPIAKKAGESCETDKQCSRLPNSSCLDGKCVSVAAAGTKIRKNGTSSPFASPARIVLTAIIMLGSRAVFA